MDGEAGGDAVDSLIPIIDLAKTNSTATLAERVGAAARGIGFFVLVNHSVSRELMARSFAESRHFFALDSSVKNALSIKRSPHNRGYVALLEEQLDPSKPGDVKEGFNIGLELSPQDPDVIAGKPFRGVNVWPAAIDAPTFRETMLEYFSACHALGRELHRAIAVDLGLDEAFFEDKLDRPLATLRLLHYPPRPASYAPGQSGAGVHTDYGNLTLLATDDAGGLEVQTRSGEWIAPPTIDGALIVNVGDCLMRWTNDVYVSTPHRVINPIGRERFSIAFFLDANPEAQVAVLESCVSAERPAKYPPIRCADYIAARLNATYAHRQ
jgi:isopenicillin N synthase-like dioxygenase